MQRRAWCIYEPVEKMQGGFVIARGIGRFKRGVGRSQRLASHLRLPLYQGTRRRAHTVNYPFRGVDQGGEVGGLPRVGSASDK